MAAILVLGCSTLSGAWAADATPPAPADVHGLINAGEFGAAAELAATLPDGQRQDLIQQTVQAQVQAGNTPAAQAMLPLLGATRDRVDAGGQVARDQLVNGGANFGPLMMLIQSVTSGPWEDEEGEGGTMQPFISGVKVDPYGMLAHLSREESHERLSSLPRKARMASLNQEMTASSELRWVSLKLLEQEVARRVNSGKPVVESMKQLAGLTKVQYVVLDSQGDILLGGPAEGWRYNIHGTALGITSGAPTLQLDDLVTVLRTFSPGARKEFGCSIDPRQDNLKAVQEFVTTSQARGPLSPAGVRHWATKIGNILGEQDITVYGVPMDSRVARVMVEADYKMKLIGLGKMEGGNDVPDYFELLAKDPSLASGSLDALRWWLTMKYEAVLHSPDHSVFEIRGSGVKCQSENQFLTSNGERQATGKAEPVNQAFAANFTAHYAELAQRDPVFAELQSIFDLALVAAMIQGNELDHRANWDRGVFAVNGDYRPVNYAAPKQTRSVVSHKVFNGHDVVLQVAGGVKGDLQSVLADSQVTQESPRLESVARKTAHAELPTGRWWWDAR